MLMGSCEIAVEGQLGGTADECNRLTAPSPGQCGRRLCYQPTGWSLLAMNGEQRPTVD